MKKHLILTSLVAFAATSVANAATDVTFDGWYNDHTKQVISGDLAGYTVDYHGTAADGSSTDESMTTTGLSSEAIDLSKFAFTSPTGATDLQSDTTAYVAADYKDNSVAGTAGYTHVAAVEDLDAATAVQYGSYKYENPQYDSSVEGSQQYITLTEGGAARTLTESYATNSEYTSGSTTITSTTAASDLIALYSYQTTDTDGNPTSHKYVLSNDGLGIKDLDNDGQAVDLSNPAIDSVLLGKLQGMLDAYADDAGTALTDATTALGALQTQENNNYDEAVNAHDADVIKQGQLVDNYATYTAAKTAEGLANTELSTKQGNYNADNQKLADARTLYTAPIETTIDDAIDASVANGSVKTALDAKANTTDVEAEALARETEDTAIRSEFAAADTTLQGNIDAEALARANADTTLQSNIDAEALARANADTTLQSNIDNEVARATAQEAAIRGEFVAADALTLNKANAYTDDKVNKLEKNVSGGVAAATALSAVNVANVKKGEVSVGGGYGYYNSQSAMAFGAAMGLTDNWSVNAGAGIAQGDKTQYTFRAGTNYKFKLF